MFVLLEYNNHLEKNLTIINKYGYTPILLFKLILGSKDNKDRQLIEINKIKNDLNLKYNALLIQVEKLDSNLQGIINSLRNDFDLILGYGGLNKINRFFLESTNIDFLVDPQNSIYKNKLDFIHHFNSGINHILCKFAKDNEIGFLLTMDFNNQKKKNLAKDVGRINQNISFARKYGINICLTPIIKDEFDIKTTSDLRSILSLFDVSSNQKKMSILALETKIKENTFKKSDNYIIRGITID